MNRVTRLPANGYQNALDPIEFERHVQEAAQPRPEIKAQLLRFVDRHAADTRVIIGERDAFDWATGVLTLTRETAQGGGMRAYLTVAHECAHARQRSDWPWLPAWALKFGPVRAFLELNAWRRCLRMLS